VSAAVTSCSGEGRSSFYTLVRKLLAGGLMKGPFGTALLGHVLHAVACRGAILVFELRTAFYLRYTSDVSMEFLLFLLGRIFALYMEVVCTLAVVVSVAEPAGCLYGARALRQAWRISAEKSQDHAGCDPRVCQGRGHRRYGGNVDQGIHIPDPLLL
jgi:hypothetical protein